MRNDHAFLDALQSTAFIDADSAIIQAFIESVVDKNSDKVAQVIQLHDAVRDQIRYDPYVVDLDKAKLKASEVLVNKRSYCIPKALLLIACCRAIGVPARLGLANVRNHLSTQAFLDLLATDVFAMHGYAVIWLEGQWVKATPTFDRALCRVFGVGVLEFNGREDSLLLPHNSQGEPFMEYLAEHGVFDDLPYELVVSELKRYYPYLFREGSLKMFRTEIDFEEQAKQERSGL